MAIRMEAMLTALIFDHSLRIRVRAEAQTSREEGSQSVTAVATPEAASAAESPVETASADNSASDDSRTIGTADSASDQAKVMDSPPETSAEGTAPPAHEQLKNLSGRLNTLITVDIDNVTSTGSLILPK